MTRIEEYKKKFRKIERVKPALAQKKEKEEKGESDEEEPSGPDPIEVKKRFSSLKRQFNKSNKACARTRTSKAAIKEQEKLGEIYQFLKLSPTQFEIIAALLVLVLAQALFDLLRS
jgi:type I site-specific restriction-modification system R (restriction) subunit